MICIQASLARACSVCVRGMIALQEMRGWRLWFLLGFGLGLGLLTLRGPALRLIYGHEGLIRWAAHLNAGRTQQAQRFLSSLPPRSFEQLAPPPGSLKLVVAMVTVGRRRTEGGETVGYLLQSTAAVLSLAQEDTTLNASFVFVCNVDPHPHHHRDAAVLKPLLPYAERYGQSSIPGVDRLPIPGTEQLFRNTHHDHVVDRERMDYTFCLQVARSMPSDYYLILQDDAVLRPDFPALLDLTLAKLTKGEACHSPPPGLLTLPYFTGPSYDSCLHDRPPYSWTRQVLEHRTPHHISPAPNVSFAFLKFYFPERWQGFALEADRLLDLASMAAVGGGVGVALQALLALSRRSGFESSWRAFWAGVAVTTVVVLAVGRQGVSELRRLSPYFYRLQASPDCCLPAVLYPAGIMWPLVTWLVDSADETNVDLRVAAFAEHYALPTFVLEPNAVRHAGWVSSVSNIDKPIEYFPFFD